MRQWIMILAVVPLLGGCCSNVSTDPTQDGLLGGTCGMATGAYNQRIAERESRLAAFKGERVAAIDENANLKSQAAQSSAELKSMKTQVGQLQRDIANKQAATSAKQQQKAQLARKATKLDADLRSLQTQTRSAPSPSQKRRKQELEQEIDALATALGHL